MSPEGFKGNVTLKEEVVLRDVEGWIVEKDGGKWTGQFETNRRDPILNVSTHYRIELSDGRRADFTAVAVTATSVEFQLSSMEQRTT